MNDNKSKFEEWFSKFNPDETGYTYNHFDYAESGWDACKKEILKQLKGFEGEYVCDVIDKIKEI